MPSPSLNPGDELVAIVDDRNVVCGADKRRRMRSERLRHRATFLFVFNRTGQVLLQRRTEQKDLYPGYWDAAAGGVVTYGETYEVSARRELAEELGIEAGELGRAFDFYFEDDANRCFGRSYTLVHEGPFELQAEEVSEVRFVDVAAVGRAPFERVTPDSLQALERLVRGQ